MCGIAGQLGMRSIEPRFIRHTLQLMSRRGPDHQDHRTWIEPTGRRCDLLHSRLSIIDLDPRSNQPFTIGGKSIVFNGELYNYREIRRELERDGFAFQTESDTETLLAAIHCYGWSVLDRLEGMWAFAVYDRDDGSLTLCRDRFGEKPLYMHRDDQGLTFGSEPKFIFGLRGKQCDVDEEHLCRFLVNGYKSLYKRLGRTFFRDLTELPPATIVRIDCQGQETRRSYWQPEYTIDESMTLEDAVAGARERLIRSVELRLRADVPIAFCMSGGVDSNSLISIAKNVFDYDVHGFTIVNSDSRYEEQDIVEQSVADLGIRHTNIPVDTADFLPKLRNLISHHDAPVYTISYFAHWLLMDAVAAHGYRISVSGTAADELFTGYYDHHLLYLSEIHKDQPLFTESAQAWREHVKPIVRNPFLQDDTAFVDNPGLRDHIYLNADAFSKRLVSPWSEPFKEEMHTPALLRNRMLNELFHEVVPVILHEDDANAMYFSIENRSPFLDRRLFEFCNRIPTRHLVSNGHAKFVLRESMRGIIPDAVVNNRRKVGFNAPILSFLDVHDPDVREQLLDQSPIFDIVQRAAIERMLSEEDLPNSESKFLFYFLATKMFLENQSASLVPNAVSTPQAA